MPRTGSIAALTYSAHSRESGNPELKTLGPRFRGDERQTTQQAERKSLRLVSRILDVRHGVDVDVAQLVADLLDLADVDGLHDVAGLRIDQHRAARAFP